MMIRKNLPISRLSGAQNTFFIINAFDPAWAEALAKFQNPEKAQLAKTLCEGFFGFQTDGLLFVRPEKNFDFAWDFFNSDGSFAEMCGNAARCATLFYYLKVAQRPELRFLTGAGEITGEVLSPSQVRIQMPAIGKAQIMNVLGQTGYFINTGVPHFVLEIQADAELSKRLRQVPDFGPAGSNITFIQNLKNGYAEAVTFERGVENFTQACGTGAVAAAMYLQEKLGRLGPIEIRMPGGLLQIEGAQIGHRPLLTGPVRYEFDFTNWEFT